MANNEAIDYQQLVKNSLLEIRKLKAKITELEQNKALEEIAVIGMACQFPTGQDGAQDLDAFWQVLVNEVDAVKEAPEARLSKQFHNPDPDAAGKIISTQGGYLNDIDQFAAEFFFISPREADSMDPQQRMLLENHWRALEHAGILPSSLMSSQTGLFAGICNNDYYHLLASRAYTDIDSYMASGTAHSTAVGRLAFYLGTQGPAIAVDTACSSSLVSIHLACQSLRAGECELALASGVNALLSPEFSINFSRAGMLSPEGRCKTFDDSADGYVRGEGCGVVVLKKLSDALRDGDNILAVIKGSATNQDGRSSGLTAPNGSAQRQVLAEALQVAGLKAEQVSYVEAHGTGTSLGDPIEIEALQAVYGSRRQTPLIIGSVKSSIGHLEGAAGIAGFIKTVLMLQHRKIPKQLHFHKPNRHVDWPSMNLQVNQQLSDWQTEPEQHRIAGISSFGFGGTNAHILVAQAPEQDRANTSCKQTHQLLTVSANSQHELQRLAQSYSDYLTAHPNTDLADFCYAANTRRDHFQYRSAFSCATVAEAISGLQNIKDGAVTQERRVAMLFTGQGAFNGAPLNDFSAYLPLLAEKLDQCEQVFKQQIGVSLKELLFTEQGAKQLLATQYAQPALFCFQVALAKTWFALGLEVECFIGHSVGEYAAACLAGVFSFEDGLRLISHRGRLMASLTEPAGMMAVLASAEKVNQALQASASQLCIAGYNGKTNTVVSGPSNELIRFGGYLDQQGLAYVELKVDRAFHSPLMAPMLEEFAAIAHSINYQSPTKTIISTKTGKLIDNEIAGADYWVDQISKPVLFTEALAELQAQEANLALEIGPQNVLTKLLQREYAGDMIQAVSSINGQDSGAELLHTFAALYQMGLNINWQNYYQGFKGRHLNLPGYPFIRKRHWFKPSARTALPEQTASLHPLLHGKLELADEAGKQVFTARLNADNPAFHQDHRYRGKILVPAAHYLEMAIAALDGTACQITQINYPAPLMVDGDDEVQLQLILTALADGYDCAIYARPSSATAAWQCHFNARIKASEEPFQPLLNRSPLTKAISVDRFYQTMSERGIDFGPCYRLLDSLSAQDGQAQGQIKAVDKQAGYCLYPPMLDACFQVAGSLLSQQDKSTFVQMGLESLSCYRAMGQGGIHAYASLREGCEPDQPVFDIDILDKDALPIVQIKGMYLKKIELSKPDSLFYKTQWQSLGFLSDDIDFAKTAAWLEHIAQTPEQYWQNQSSTDAVYLPALESQALNHVMQALLDLAFPYQLDEPFNLQQCQQQLGVLPRYAKLLNRCLTALMEAKYLAKQQEQWRLVRPLAANPQHSAIDSSIEMQLLNQCGRALAGVLTGKTDFLPLLFPENSDISAATLYSQAEGFKLLNNSAVQALKGWLALVPKGRKVKVLEIGAGTGGTTRHVLPLLAGMVDFEYTYTDLSAAFFAQAETNFADYDQLVYQTLDISQNPKTQGFAEHDFDLVIAANVIHATADLNKTLAHVRRLLSANGVLMLLEGLKPQLWVDLIFGLTDGWWAFTDHRINQNYPLLDENGWQQVLTQAGFNQPTLITAKQDATERLCRQSVILTQPANTAKAINWLVLKDRQGLADSIVAYLTAQGDTCTLVSCGQNFAQVDGVWTVNPFQENDFKQLVNHWLKQSEPATRAVLNCWPLDAQIAETSQSQDVEDKLGQLCAGTLHLVQALGARNAALQAFNVITQGAQQVGKNDQLQPAMTALWGMVRVVAKEYPQFHCRLLDVQSDVALSMPIVKQFTQIGSTSELQGALRDRQLFVPRLAACELTDSKPLAIKEQGVYLVTGAFGGMGFKVTQWLIEQGAKHLILLARTAPSESVKQWLEQAKANGIAIHVEAVDIGDYLSLKQAVDKHCNDRQALAGIFHSAGVFADRLLQDYDWSVFSQVFPAKVQGSWNLHRLSTELNSELDYFVLFSSSASLLAPSGLANYVAANAFIDALAAYRQQKNQPTHSINWGVWQDTGMAAAVNDIRRHQWQVMGVRPMQAETALNAMQTVMGSDEANMAIIDIDFNDYVNSLDAGNRENYFQAVLSQQPDQAQKNRASAESIVSLLQQNPDRQQELMLNHISQLVGSVLGISADIDLRRGFFELGMDSLTSMELRNRLQRELEITLDATLTFKYPTVSALSDYLLSVLINANPKQEAAKAEPVPEKHHEQDLNNESILSLDEQLADIDRFLDDI